MAAFRFPLKYGFTIFSANSVSREAGTLCSVKSTGKSFSNVNGRVLFFMATTRDSRICQKSLKRKPPKRLTGTGERDW